MKRREFIILTGVGATSSTLLSACGHPEEKLIPALIPDDQYVPGIDYWKASTCGMCPAGCGIIVRTREHKANKIEGNPLHPVNRGALCARGQAGLEVLYNPDRIKGPMKRIGERGEGKWEEISWEEAIKTLVENLRGIDTGTKWWEQSVFVAKDLSGVTGLAARWLEATIGTTIATEESFPERWRVACSEAYCPSVSPQYDMANATYLLSFGARFLETGSPVKHSLDFGEFRRSTGKPRGRFVQIEPRMSLTGANADEWLPAVPGTEGLVALAIAQVIVREGLIPGAITPGFIVDTLDLYAPEQTAHKTDVAVDKIIRIAREFASSPRPLAMSSQTVGTLTPNRDGECLVDVEVHMDVETLRPGAVYSIKLLNALVGNLDKPGGVLLPGQGLFPLFTSVEPEGSFGEGPLHESTITGQTVLMIHHTNPGWSSPRMRDRILDARFIASFSSFVDETTAVADLVLPDHSFLERWDIVAQPIGKKDAVVSLSRPVVRSEHNTRQTEDVLFEIVHALQNAGVEPPVGDKKQSLSVGSAEELVKLAASYVWKARGSIKAEDFEGFWATIVERGVWIGELKGENFVGESRSPKLEFKHIQDNNADEYPYFLEAYEHMTLGLGQNANLPALQELPDPMTSAMWGSWVEINPKTAGSLGITDGELVEVRTAYGAVTAPALLYRAIRPDTIAMPYGQGHVIFGRYGSGRGANPATLIPPPTSSGYPMGVRASVTRVGDNGHLIRFGTDLQEQMENRR